MFWMALFSFMVTACESAYDQGYRNGFAQGSARGYANGMDEGRKLGERAGYDKGYAAAMSTVGGGVVEHLRTIDGVLFASQSSLFIFGTFAAINLLTLVGASLYLIARVPDSKVVIAKALVYVLSSYCWFRVFQPQLMSDQVLVSTSGGSAKVFAEIACILGAFVLCLIFDRLYIRSERRHVWVDVAGIAFCTWLFLLLLHLVVNYELLFVASDHGFALQCIEGIAIGGIAYTSFSLLARFVTSGKAR
jgi:hypothetical protein